MKIISVFGAAVFRTVEVWMVTLVFAIFIILTIWVALEALSRGADTRILQAALMIPQALFTGLSAVILYQAFENKKNQTEIEIPFERLMSLTVSISIITFLINIITSVGSMLCFVPGIFAMVGFFLAQITLFKEDTTVLDSLYQSWSKTDGHRLDIFFLLAIAFGVTLVVAVPVFGGAIYMLFAEGGSTASAGFLVKGALATLFGTASAIGMSFARALEYTVYMEISPPMDRWLRPSAATNTAVSAVPEHSPVHMEPAYQAPVPAPPRAPERAPIEVGDDIVFGKGPNDDKDGW